jgi:hypothetical protein
MTEVKQATLARGTTTLARDTAITARGTESNLSRVTASDLL